VTVAVSGGAVTIVGMKDAASTMPYDASRLYAKNVANFIELMTVDGAVSPTYDDEVVAGASLVRDGTVQHAPTAALVDPAPATEAN
jgi:NAD(P) transhydrogenase subunit alpha